MKDTEDKIAKEAADKEKMQKEIDEMEKKKKEALEKEIVEHHSPLAKHSSKGAKGKGDSASESGFSNMEVQQNALGNFKGNR